MEYKILVTVSRILFPFVLLFGFYIIVNGDSSVGGGFQGGVILATSYLLYYFIVKEHPFTLSRMLKVDKYLFFLFPIVFSLSLITKGHFFTNFVPENFPLDTKRLYLIILNILIGLKVSIGFVSLFFVFLEEGNS